MQQRLYSKGGDEKEHVYERYERMLPVLRRAHGILDDAAKSMCKGGRKCFIAVFDVDDTVLLADGAPCMAGMELYETCRRHRIPVYFVTAREEEPETRTWTKRQLRAVGAGSYAGLIMQPATASARTRVFSGTSSFKTRTRADLATRTGCAIILNVGDQWTDVVEFGSEKEIDLMLLRDDGARLLFQPREKNVVWALKL